MIHQKKLLLIGSLSFLVIVLSIISCKKESNPVTTDPLAVLNLPSTPFNYSNQPLPNYLNGPNVAAQNNTPIDNPTTDWGATLGRVLFYDKILSINNSISCASCHKQDFAFSDNAALSTGFAGGHTGRNSMSLINAKFYPNGRFFWDERAATLEIQTLMPVQDAVEMGMRLDTLVNRLKIKTHYPYLFRKAFGDETINMDRIAKALAQFVRSIVSYQSKFDMGRQQILPGQDPILTPYVNFTPEENQGKQLFFSPLTACNSCHGTETFTAPNPRNNGLENPSIDRGVGGVTNMPAQFGSFKISSLKNVELTSPYMHDGRFATLEQVI